jgi:phospholipid transport system substrate-binding protein
MVIRRAAIGFLVCAAMLALRCSAAEPESPRELIETASDHLIQVLRERRDAVRSDPQVALAIARETVLPLLDFQRAAKWVLGPHWRSASDDQRTRFTEAFRDFLVRTYVTAMSVYVDEIIAHGNRVTYLPVHMGADDEQAVVRAIIHLQSGVNAEVGYRLHRRDGPWKIFDVTLEGVSMLTTYRISFASEIERDGLDALIERLQRRAASDATPLEGLVGPKPRP